MQLINEKWLILLSYLFVLRDRKVPTLIFYNLEGKKVGQYYFSTSFPSNIRVTDDHVISYSNFTMNKEGYMFRVLSSDYTKKKSVSEYGCMPYQRKMVDFLTLGLNDYFFTSKDRILVHEFANDTIYALDRKSGRILDTATHVTFIGKGLALKFNNSDFIKDAAQYVLNKNISTLYDLIWENDRYLFFNYMAKQKEIFFLWDKIHKKQVFNTTAILSLKNNIQLPTLWFGSNKGAEVLTYYNSSNIFADENSLSRFGRLSPVFSNYKRTDNPIVCILTLIN